MACPLRPPGPSSSWRSSWQWHNAMQQAWRTTSMSSLTCSCPGLHAIWTGSPCSPNEHSCMHMNQLQSNVSAITVALEAWQSLRGSCSKEAQDQHEAWRAFVCSAGGRVASPYVLLHCACKSVDGVEIEPCNHYVRLASI